MNSPRFNKHKKQQQSAPHIVTELDSCPDLTSGKQTIIRKLKWVMFWLFIIAIVDSQNPQWRDDITTKIKALSSTYKFENLTIPNSIKEVLTSKTTSTATVVSPPAQTIVLLEDSMYYPQPSSFIAPLGTIMAGSEITLITSNKGWANVYYKGKNVWIRGADIMFR